MERQKEPGGWWHFQKEPGQLWHFQKETNWTGGQYQRPPTGRDSMQDLRRVRDQLKDSGPTGHFRKDPDALCGLSYEKTGWDSNKEQGLTLDQIKDQGAARGCTKQPCQTWDHMQELVGA